MSRHREFQQRLTPLKKTDPYSLKIDKITCEDIDDYSVQVNYKPPVKNKVYPPPEDIYIPKKNKITHESVKYGLNMCFKKYHPFSSDPEQGGGELNSN